jgi:small subunit ribosomal protein S20
VGQNIDMPITKSAKKAVRGSARKRAFNDRRKKAMRESIKDIRKLVIQKKDAESAKEKLSAAYKAIDKAAKRGVIKKNTAARKKSRLTTLINKAS